MTSQALSAPPCVDDGRRDGDRELKALEAGVFRQAFGRFIRPMLDDASDQTYVFSLDPGRVMIDGDRLV